jgi:ferrous iron transport protein A
MLLADAPAGVPLKVDSVTCGCGVHTRLASMGILPGEIIKIVHRENGGPIVLEVKGTRVAIGRGVGLKVIVTTGNGADEG